MLVHLSFPLLEVVQVQSISEGIVTTAQSIVPGLRPRYSIPLPRDSVLALKVMMNVVSRVAFARRRFTEI